MPKWESEVVESLLEIYRAVRYIYPDGVVPIEDFAQMTSPDPSDVPPVFGAIGFDYVHLIYFDFQDRRLRHIVAEAETYYWGTELSREEMEAFPRISWAVDRSGADRFLLSSWGGFVPLKSFEFAVTPSNLLEPPGDAFI